MIDMSREQLLKAMTSIDHTGSHCRNRIFEWMSTFMMVGIAVCVLITPRTIEMGAFRFMVEIGMTSGPVAIIFAVFGALRVVALYANGKWQPLGARARFAGALVAALMWFQMLLALFLLGRVTGTLSIGIPVYLALTIGEILSCHKAAIDEN